MTIGDLALSNPDVGINSCGLQSTAVVLLTSKNPADVSNVITVSIAGAAPPTHRVRRPSLTPSASTGSA